MQIILTPEQEQFLEAQLKSGKYTNPQEVITQAFKLLEEQEIIELPPYIKGSESAKKLLVEKIKKYREIQEKNKDKPINPERERLAEEFKRLCEETQRIPGIQDITEEEIAAEIEAYRRGE